MNTATHEFRNECGGRYCTVEDCGLVQKRHVMNVVGRGLNEDEAGLNPTEQIIACWLKQLTDFSTVAPDAAEDLMCRMVAHLESVQLANEQRIAELEAALREIVKGKGPFARDPLTHANNTIRSMISLASVALSATGPKG